MIKTGCDTGPPTLLTQTSTSTVDRRWVHREAVSEVFLTDVVATGDTSFTAHCQLPRRHSYYGDTPENVVDPMVLLESCRQAETCGAHTMLGVPLGSSFVLNRWTFDGTVVHHDDSGPLDLEIEVSAAPRTGARGRSVTCTWTMELRVDDEPVGIVTMDVTYLESGRYAALRAMRRGGVPPMSSEYVGPRPTTAVDVGRTDRRNVLLSEVTDTADGLAAVLSPPTDHPSLFDHPLDHVPGMAVTEAAKQLAVAVGGSAAVTGLDAEFHRYVELDEPTEMTATSGHDGAGVRVVQNGQVAAEVSVRCEPARVLGLVA